MASRVKGGSGGRRMISPVGHSINDDPSTEESRPLIANISTKDGRRCYIPARIVLVICSFTGFVSTYTLRLDLNLALLEMVEDEKMANHTHNVSNVQKFDWSEEEQNIALSAFYYGYCATQVLGGYLSGRFGARRILGFSSVVTSLLALVTPVAAKADYFGLIVCRVGQGLAQGLGQPCMHNLWARWGPASEKTKLMTFTYAGSQMGSIIATFVTSYICEYSGWPLVFYVFGGVGIMWAVTWFALAFDTPRQHPRISPAELAYIESTVLSVPFQKTNIRIPWRQILTCPRFLAIAAAHFASDWGIFVLTNYMPVYLNRALGFDMKRNGFLSSLPFIILLFIYPMSGYVADALCTRNILDTKNTRKLMTSLGLLVPSILMIGVSQTGSNKVTTIALMILAIGFTGFNMAGFSVNHIDIAPPIAGLLYGMTNTVGTTSGFLGPVIVDTVVSDQKNLNEWRTFFYITAVIFFIGGLIFALFAGGEQEAWAVLKDDDEEEEVGDPTATPRAIPGGAKTNPEDQPSTSSTYSGIDSHKVYDDVDWRHYLRKPKNTGGD